ncbi:MAG: hypothetical protein AB9846_09065 [Tenuifilaceae bacterium]
MKKRIQFIVIPIFLFLILFSGCELGGESYVRYEVFPNINGWDLPDTANVNTPFGLYLISSIESSCVKNLSFYYLKYNDYEYIVSPRAIFENHGEECYEVEEIVDTTLAVTLDKVGKYYFYFRYNATPKVDSIVIE